MHEHTSGKRISPFVQNRAAIAWRTVLPVLLLVGLSRHLPAQSASGTQFSGIYRVAGTVMNAATGEPIRGASVAVLAEADSRIVEAAFSDTQGRFALTGLAAGKYQLTASKRGFRTAFYDEHDEYSTAIVTGPGQDTGGLAFRLVPGAILRGIVTADGGDPVENARVMLLKRPRGHKPGERIAQVEAQVTDDTGAYEFSNLSDGEYLVAVTAEPWYAMHRPSGAAGDSASQPDSSTPLDVAYPTTFFDSTTDEAAAATITLTAGTAEQANINLHAVPALNLRVQLPRRQDGATARPELRQSIFGVQTSAQSIGIVSPQRNSWVEFTGVAPGHYELIQGDPPRIAEFDASASQQIDPALGTPTVEITGAVKTASGAALPPDVTVALESADGELRREPIQSNAARGGFRFPAVPPGKWTITTQAAGRQLAVLTTTVGATTHPGNTIAVGDRPIQVTLSVSRGNTRVEGFVRKDGKGVPGAMVVLVPENLASIPELARRDQSDSDGSFSLRDAAPGRYTVVAIQNGWDLDWTKAEIIARFLPGGTAVTVTDTPEKRMALAAAVQAQSP